MNRIRLLLHVLIALVPGLPLCAQEKEHAIGDKGAAVALGSAWQRQVVDKDLGEDQFLCSDRGGFLQASKQMYVVVLEVGGLLENKSDYRRTLDAMAVVGREAEIEVVDGPKWRRVSRAADTRLNGIALTFRCELLIADGLAYHLMAWSMQGQRDFLATRLAEFRDGFTFPAETSDWARSLRPQVYAKVIGDLEVSFEYRPGLLRIGEEEGFLATWASADDEHGMFLQVWDELANADAAVDSERSSMHDWDATYRLVDQVDRRIDGVDCVLVSGRTDWLGVQTLLVPLGGQRWASLRYQATGTASDGRAERDAIFASVRLQRLVGELALPAIDAPDVAEAETRLSRFLAAARQLHELDGWSMSAQRLDDGSHLLWDWQRLFLVTADGYRLLAADADGELADAARWGKDWLVVVGGNVHAVADGVTQPAVVCAAHRFDTVGADLLIVRSSGKAVLGLTAGYAEQSMALLRRAPAGTETEIAVLGRAHVDRIVADRAGRRALLSGYVPDPEAGGHRAVLWRVDLASGEVETVSGWQQIQAIGCAASGWIVSGRPIGKAAGIWHLPVSGAIEPLLSGQSVAGLSANESTLWFTAGNSGRLRVLEVPLARCRSEGAACEPWGLDGVTAVGVALLADADVRPPATAAAIRATAARLHETARAIVGHDLPVGPGDLDRLIAQLCDPTQPVMAPARIVLNLLVTATALEAGAEWIETPIADWGSWHVRTAPPRSSLFALAQNPCNLVASCLDDSEGVYAVLSELRDEAAGRRIVLGVDPAALSARAQTQVPEDFAAAMAQGRLDGLRPILTAHADNTLLRREVYGALARAGNLAAVETLAGEWAARTPPVVVDLVAWFAAWNERARDVPEARRMFELARRAVDQHPREAALYYFLGQAGARAFPREPAKARRCYDRVLELQQWGAYADAARAELGQ